MNLPFADLILNHLQVNQSYPDNLEIDSVKPLYGGCINQVYLIKLKLHNGTLLSEFIPDLVVKENSQKPIGFFEKEFVGLEYLYSTTQKHAINIRIPRPLGVFSSPSPNPLQILIMEYISPSNKQDYDSSKNSWRLFGQGLSYLHQKTAKERVEKSSIDKKFYGWHENTYIGSNIQKNTLEKNWIVFFQKHRLLPQLKLGVQNHLLPKVTIKKLEHVIKGLDKYLPPYPPASLLHGDLWTGNFFFSNRGEPVIYDPAIYYGHGETDLALTELFGSFPNDFYEGYHSVFPRDHETKIRKTIYNLYHLLNHLNLFGNSYLSSVENSLGFILKNY